MNPNLVTARRRRRTLVSALLVVAGAACATPQRVELYRPDRGDVVLHVVNRGWSEVNVYLADGNVPYRLGTVRALDRARLAIPNQAGVMRVRLLVRALGSDEVYAAEPVLPGAGGVIELTVQPVLVASEVSVLSYGALGG